MPSLPHFTDGESEVWESELAGTSTQVCPAWSLILTPRPDILSEKYSLFLDNLARTKSTASLGGKKREIGVGEEGKGAMGL